MIVIGVDVHKQSMTAVAVDEAGRMLDERTVVGADDGLVTWASQVSSERLWAIAQLARHSGVAPLEASSGRIQRHRLDRGGNRQLNAALYRIAITQARYHPAARAYLERKQTEGKSRREAIRCLKRTLVRVVFNTLKASPALT